jgi:cytochrome oxidase Cu insertion factor (SCO1/SenC/PrrC family)
MTTITSVCVALPLAGLFVGLVVRAQEASRPATRARIDVSKLGPQVGERVPDFSLVDQTGATRTLRSVMGRNGAMLAFVRSADW